VTSPRTYEERKFKPIRPCRQTLTTLLLLLLLLLLALHPLHLAHLLLLSMFELVALLPVDDGTPNEHPRGRIPSWRRRNRARCTPTASRRRRATACAYTLATSSAIRRAEYGIFESPRLSVKPRSTRWGRAASIDEDDDDGRSHQELEPTIRRALGEAAPSLLLPWNER
jgi:hypothetical protein